MSYIEASDTSLRKTGQIKLHGPGGFAGMRKAGALVAKCLDELTDIVKPGVPTSRIDDFVRDFAFGHGAWALPKTVEAIKMSAKQKGTLFMTFIFTTYSNTQYCGCPS